MSPKKGEIKMEDGDSTEFLNVDLDIEASFDLAPIVEALGDRVANLYTGPVESRFESHLELSAVRSIPHDPDVAVRGFLELLSTLPPAARHLWENATKREFNIGVQGGVTPHAFAVTLERETITAVAQERAQIGFTVYACERKNASSKTKRPG